MSWEDLCEFAVEYGLRLGADYVEARFQTDEASTFLVKNGNVEAGGISRLQGIGIRAIVGGSLGFSSVNIPKKLLIEKRVKECVNMAKSASRVGEKVRFSEEKFVEEKWEVKERVRFEDVSSEEKVNFLLNIDRRISSREEVGADIRGRILELSEMWTKKYFVSSDGGRVSSYVPRIFFTACLTAVKNGDSEQAIIERGESGGWEVMKRLKVDEECVEKAKILGRILAEAKKAPAGEMDAILGSEVVGIAVHESAGHPCEADRILGREAAQAGESFVKREMLGEKIGSELVTVIDDPTLEHSYGFYLFDDEGVKARPRCLMKNGVINEFLHNRETAFKFGTRSNGASRSSDFGKEPIIRMANTYMASGDYRLDELISETKRGIHIKNYMEWNIDDLRYNMRIVGSESYLIENGEMKGMIRRPVIEITTPEFYRRIDAVGKDVQFYAGLCGKGDPLQGVPVWLGGPSVRLKKVRLV